MTVTGAVGRLAASGLAGFTGLTVAAFAVLAIMVGRGLTIPLPNTPFWQDQGIAVNLPATGLLAAIVGWSVAWAAGRIGRRPAFRRASERAA